MGQDPSGLSACVISLNPHSSPQRKSFCSPGTREKTEVYTCPSRTGGNAEVRTRVWLTPESPRSLPPRASGVSPPHAQLGRVTAPGPCSVAHAEPSFIPSVSLCPEHLLCSGPVPETRNGGRIVNRTDVVSVSSELTFSWSQCVNRGLKK